MAEQQHRSFKLSHRESEQFYDLTEHQPILEYQDVSICSSDHNLVCREPPNVLDENDIEELCRTLSSSTNSDLLLQTLDRSTITFTPELVEAILRRSQRHGSSALQYFSWVGIGKDLKHRRTLYHEMRRRPCSIEPNAWTIMISQYGQAGLTEIALKTFKEMKAEGYQPNGGTFKYLIVYLCGKKGRKIEEAIKVFQEMLASGYIPDKEMVDIFLSSLCELRKFSEARIVVNSLCKRGFQNQIAYSLLIKSLCRAGKVEEAIVLTDEFR
ncbi:hypothetical protein KFK09_008477 [Dendrobium nobile]|uniref:Pentatricopeptide repeat-containing protein n=1 Tax=Dendrobium nobile TaxID=94219 RepID=A0A8T3BMU3_DENNO|nr:hypothetical protein KFK09_008477 [Dendrobium nobile]